MASSLLFSLSALAALVPASLLPLRGKEGPDPVFWAAVSVAAAGPALWAFVQLSGAWQTGLSAALWLTVSASMVLFAGLAAIARPAWRLTVLLLPYLILLAILATMWQQAPGRPLPEAIPVAWLQAHIVAAVTTYGLITIAAVAGLAVLLQERALKAKRPTGLTRLLPPVADSERLQVRLLIAAEIVLGLGLLTGMATQYLSSGGLLAFDHKTLFSVLAFVLIAALLGAHYRAGMRGRRAARLVLLAYLLLTLAYPGVKFVTDVLLA
ncbi:MAG: inner membrane protein YpjD [Alphaproteobacteria bacterium]